MRANLQPQLFSQRLALLEALEELIEDADNDGIDADAFGFCPFLEFVAGFCSDVEELGIGQFHAGLAGLLNIDFVFVNVAQSKKDDPGQVALYARLFGDGFAEIEWKAQCHAWPVVRPPLPLTVHLASCRLFGCFLYCLLDCHWHPFLLLRVFCCSGHLPPAKSRSGEHTGR